MNQLTHTCIKTYHKRQKYMVDIVQIHPIFEVLQAFHYLILLVIQLIMMNIQQTKRRLYQLFVNRHVSAYSI